MSNVFALVRTLTSDVERDFFILQHPDRAKNGLDRAKNGLDRAKNGLDRAKNGLDRAKNGLDRAKNGLDRAKNGLDRAKNGLDRQHTTSDPLVLLWYFKKNYGATPR
jgi:hypothetical protein